MSKSIKEPNKRELEFILKNVVILEDWVKRNPKYANRKIGTFNGKPRRQKEIVEILKLASLTDTPIPEIPEDITPLIPNIGMSSRLRPIFIAAAINIIFLYMI